MTNTESLLEMATATADAVAGVLRTYLPDDIEVGTPEVVASDVSALDGLAVPAVAADSSYTDGSVGGNLFVSTVVGARRLAGAVMGSTPGTGGQPLDERELAALGEAMAQVMAAAAAATTEVLGHEVGLSVPKLSDIESVLDAVALAEGAQHATRVELTVAGEPWRFAQLIPKTFVLRMSHAEEGAIEVEAEELEPSADGPLGTETTVEILRGVNLRVCAEIGRTTMVSSRAVAMPRGGIIELDSGAEEAVDVLVNGLRFAIGRLVLVDEEWAVRIEEVLMDPAELEHASTVSAVDRG